MFMHMVFFKEEDHNFEVYVEVCQDEMLKKKIYYNYVDQPRFIVVECIA
jgi:hypothetical protein